MTVWKIQLVFFVFGNFLSMYNRFYLINYKFREVAVLSLSKLVEINLPAFTF